MTNAANKITAPEGIQPVRTLLVTSFLLGVPERAVMSVMGWSNTAMAVRYQHVMAAVQHDIASRVGGPIWQTPMRPSGDE